MTIRETVNNEIENIADAIGPLVAHIESQPMTTQGHYGDYLAAMTHILDKARSKGSDAVKLAIGLAFIRAGANRQGVQAALRIMGAL